MQSFYPDISPIVNVVVYCLLGFITGRLFLNVNSLTCDTMMHCFIIAEESETRLFSWVLIDVCHYVFWFLGFSHTASKRNTRSALSTYQHICIFLYTYKFASTHIPHYVCHMSCFSDTIRTYTCISTRISVCYLLVFLSLCMDAGCSKGY